MAIGGLPVTIVSSNGLPVTIVGGLGTSAVSPSVSTAALQAEIDSIAGGAAVGTVGTLIRARNDGG